MEENIWKYGEYDLDKKELFKYLLSNLDSYLTYHDISPEKRTEFSTILNNVKLIINNGLLESIGGFGNFTDHSGTLDKNNEITLGVLDYVNKIASGYAKKLENTVENTVERKPKKVNTEEGIADSFSFSKHGLQNYFVKQTNPLLLQSNLPAEQMSEALNETITSWRNSFNSSSDAIKDLGNMLDSYIAQESLKNLDYSQSFNNYDSYIRDVSTLREGLKDGTLDGIDRKLLTKLGLSELKNYFIEINNPNNEQEIVNNGLDDVALDNTEEITTNEDKPQASKSKIGGMSLGEYVDKFKELGLEESDSWRLGGLAADILSILNPEPISAAGLGYASDYANYHADELDGINNSYWDDVFNVGLSTLGAIPVLGDLGMSGKIAKNLTKTSKILLKLALIPGIFMGVANAEELLLSLLNIAHNNFTVNDLRNAWTVVQLALGFTNAVKSGKSKSKSNTLRDAAPEALEVKVKNNGKNQTYHFKGKDRQELEKLKDKPEEFKQYIQNNFKGFDNLESVQVKNIKGKRKFEIKRLKNFDSPLYKEPSTKEVDYSIVKLNDDLPNGIKWNLSRTRQYLKDLKKSNYATPNDSGKNSSKTSNDNSETAGVFISDNVEIDIPSIKPDDTEINTPATEIKPDIKPDLKPNLRKTKKEILNKLPRRNKIPKQIEDDLKLIKVLDDFEGTAQGVSEGKIPPTPWYIRVRDYLKSRGFDEKDITEWLLKKKAYKQGGIIKAQEGIKFYGTDYTPVLWENLYETNQILGELGGNSYRSTSKLTNKTTASQEDLLDLNTYASRYRPYSTDEMGMTNRISDLLKVITDFRNSEQNSTFDDFLRFYNLQIDNFYENKRKFGYKVGEFNESDNIKSFNSRHRAVYNSANSDNGVYGYDDRYSNINGTTTLARGVDITEDDLEMDLSKFDENIRTWIGDNKLFKASDGRYYRLNNSILNDPDDSTDGSVDKSGDNSDIITPRPVETKNTKIKIPKPEKPNTSNFSLDKVLAGINYYKTLRHNDLILKYVDSIDPLLYDPVEHHKSVYGNLRALIDGLRAAGRIISKSTQPLTSDGDLQTAARLDAQNQANEYIFEGLKIDDEAIRKSQETAWLQEKANKENRYNIAMKNRENMHLVNLEKLQARINKNRADYESTTNLIKEIRTWITTLEKLKLAKELALYARNLLNYINQNPNEYIAGWGSDKSYFSTLWNKSQKGEKLTTQEQNIINQILERLYEAYYNELYGEAPYLSYSIDKPAWSPVYKKGGRISDNIAKTIIEYLKESNNNYNKAIDRSIKGLYNHIKLQRKK